MCITALDWCIFGKYFIFRRTRKLELTEILLLGSQNDSDVSCVSFFSHMVLSLVVDWQFGSDIVVV